MALVMIKCPHTARAIWTGVEFDVPEFELLPDVARKTDCAACGMVHTWWKREAWLADPSGRPITDAPKFVRPYRMRTTL